MSALTSQDDGRRSERLEQRLSARAKEIIEHAAALQGVTPSEFARSHTLQAARETISRLEVTRLMPEDRDALLRALDDDRPIAALVEVLETHIQATERRRAVP